MEVDPGRRAGGSVARDLHGRNSVFSKKRESDESRIRTFFPDQCGYAPDGFGDRSWPATAAR